jgi:hypothetical protein
MAWHMTTLDTQTWLRNLVGEESSSLEESSGVDDNGGCRCFGSDRTPGVAPVGDLFSNAMN